MDEGPWERGRLARGGARIRARHPRSQAGVAKCAVAAKRHLVFVFFVLKAPQISEELLGQLREHLAERRIHAGNEWLRRHRALLDSVGSETPHSAILVGHLAQWVDISFADADLIRQLLQRFPASSRRRLPLEEYVHLRLAEGLVAMAEEELDQAIAHFDLVISLAGELAGWKIPAIAHFWKARCLRKKGEYDVALEHALAGKRLAAELSLHKVAAVMSVLESWLLFQKGRPREAFRILEQAEAVLAGTDDYVTLGNSQSAYGRMVRRD